MLFAIVKYYNNILGGWDATTFWHGGVRMLFSFTMGMIIYRNNWQIKNKLNFFTIGILLMLAFFAPYNEHTNWIIEPLIIIVYFPLIITLGVGSRNAFSKNNIAAQIGNLSYPLYITHYAVMWIFGQLFAKYEHQTNLLTAIIITFFIIQIIVAYVSMKWIDIPIRKRLMKKIKGKNALGKNNSNEKFMDIILNRI